MTQHITPGCTAIVHGLTRDAHRNGSSVRVIGLHALCSEWMEEPWWQIDTSDERDLFSERNLLRIDGGEPEAVEQRDDMEVPA